MTSIVTRKKKIGLFYTRRKGSLRHYKTL